MGRIKRRKLSKDFGKFAKLYMNDMAFIEHQMIACDFIISESKRLLQDNEKVLIKLNKNL